MKPETVTFTQEVAIADKDGVAITEGSVLKKVGGSERGVVTRIIRAGDRSTSPFACIGDLNIRSSHCSTIVSNKYKSWQHIPHDEQTYEERYLSWSAQPWVNLIPSEGVSDDEEKAVSGIMTLIPDYVTESLWFEWPRTFDDALRVLADHLQYLVTPPKLPGQED